MKTGVEPAARTERIAATDEMNLHVPPIIK
jgi:hypothetical protein